MAAPKPAPMIAPNSPCARPDSVTAASVAPPDGDRPTGDAPTSSSRVKAAPVAVPRPAAAP
jgi:hypothetical protein